MSQPLRTMMISTHGYVSANPELGKPDTGGQVVYVLELSRCLGRLGHHVDIFTRRFEDQPELEWVERNVRIIRIPCGGPDFIPKETLIDDLPEWIEGAKTWIDRDGARYRWINSHYWDAAVVGQALSDHLAVPHFHTPHSLGSWKRDNMDGDPQELEKQYNFRQRIAYEKAVYHACDGVIATTPEQETILTSENYRLASNRIHVLPPGCDPMRFRPVSRLERDKSKSHIGLEGPFVLALGRLAENKGYDLLIRAMKPVFERHDDVRLVLAVGSNNENDHQQGLREELKSLAAELDCEDRVIFRSYVPDEELPTYYQAADVFALSSRYEPFGMTAIEAMACGTPTVVTTEGGLSKQVTWGLDCLCANPFDTDAFGHAIHSALRYTALSRQLSQHGAYKARTDFAWAGIARNLAELLERAPVTATQENPEWIELGS